MQPPVQRLARAAQLARSPRARKIVVWTAAAVALLAIIGFFVAPPIAKSQLEQVLSEKLHRQVTIERVRINPFAVSASILGFAVKERDGSATAVSFDELYVDLSYASLFRLAPVVEAVHLTKPHVRLVRNADKTYNFQDLIDEPRAESSSDASGPPPRFAVYNIQITGGRIDFDDQPEHVQHSVIDLRIGIPFLSNLPSQVDIQVQPELSAKVNGAPLSITGETKPFKDTRETTVRIDLDDVQLAKYFDYVPVPLRFRVASGRLDTHLVVALATTRERFSQLTVSGSASLQELAVRQLDGAPIAGLGKLAVDLNSLDLLARSAAVKSVRLEAPSVELARLKDGRINLLETFAVPPTATPAPEKPGEAKDEGPFACTVGEITLADGIVRIADDVPTNPSRIELQNIAVTLKDLGNAPNAKAAAQLSFDTDAKGRLAYDGTLQLTPLRVGGKIDFAGFRIAKFQPYVGDALNLELAGGLLELSTAFDAGFEGERVDGRLENLAATATGLELVYPGDKDALWQIPVMELKGGSVDIAKQHVSIGEWSIRDPKAHVRRDADGSTHYARLVKGPSGESANAKGGEADWRVDVKRLSLINGTVVIDDRVPPSPVVTRLTRFALEVGDASNAHSTRSTVNLRTVVKGKHTVANAGPLRRLLPAGALQVDVKGLELAPFQPYLEERANLVLTSGAVSATGTVELDFPEGGPNRVAYRGDFGVADFASLDRATSQDLLKWQSLFASGIDFDLEPFKVAVNEVALSDFYSRLIVNADGTLNLQGVMTKPAGESAPAEASGAAKPEAGSQSADKPADSTSAVPRAPRALSPNLRIGKIALQGGNINFSDFFVKPNYSANLTGVGGGVTEMTAEKAGDVELRGRVDQIAPIEILGRVNALSPDLFVDLKASAKDIELPPLSPYAVKYAGYGIERGKLSVNVKYVIESRKLVAENNIYLDQLTFGDKVESPTATKLPVLLAVALLKDRNGVIDVNLPISGSLDDPQFSLGGTIIRVIVNLIVKAVTAPFALLGSLFGGGEELAYVEFAPGSARLDANDETKLNSLAKALTDRPGLKLDVSGRVDPEVDREGLKRLTLEREVKAAKLKETAPSGKRAVALDDVTIESSEYSKYLAAAYNEAKFAKPRNAVGLVKDLPVPEMEQLMLANASATDEDLQQLANARAQSAKDWLVENGKIPAERVFLVSPKVGADGIKDKGKPTRVDFSLK